MKYERAFRVVMRGMHPQISTEYLKEEITNLGYEVSKVTNVISRKNKNPLPLFFNKKIYEVKAIGNY